jgi:hypothetical protein
MVMERRRNSRFIVGEVDVLDNLLEMKRFFLGGKNLLRCVRDQVSFILLRAQVVKAELEDV